MNKHKQIIKYLLSDYCASAVAWGVFFIYRKVFIESMKYGFEIPIKIDSSLVLGILVLPFFWLLIYYSTGYYKDIFRKSRLKELWDTLSTSVFGVVVIFFVLILDDEIYSYKNYYQSFFTLLTLHFVLTYIPRVIITSVTIGKIRRSEIGFNTLLIGNNGRAVNLYRELTGKKKSTGNIFVGFVGIKSNVSNELMQTLPCLGLIDNLVSIIKQNKIEEVLIAIESSEHEEVWRIINRLQGVDVRIEIIPTLYDILTGAVNMSTIYGMPLIQIKHDLMPAWEENLKRVIDILVSLTALIVLMPLYVFLAIGVRMSSKGPIFYSHERIGRYGKPFVIFKFRSMYVDAEQGGPALSSKSDNRITPFGLFMRKSRLDEIPQFYNVLIGDMSLVGPRPERQYFIDKIVEKAPHYLHLHKVRPGITSWGQVKFGYAENVDQMVERLKYDLIYIENMTLYSDFKILIYTVKTVLQASGK